VRDPSSFEAWYYLGAAYFELGQYNYASTSLRNATRLDPNNTMAHKVQCSIPYLSSSGTLEVVLFMGVLVQSIEGRESLSFYTLKYPEDSGVLFSISRRMRCSPFLPFDVPEDLVAAAAAIHARV
jgi:tetratricopeptide (TPR) repeat protein